MRSDRLYDLFAELRRLKTVELPAAENKLYPVQRALRIRSVHGDIQRIEKEIEREMDDGRVSGSHEAGE